MVDHDIKPGKLEHCQICGCEDLALVIDLGHQPLCDTLLSKAQLNEPETTFPLRLFRCPKCTLTQLDYAVPGDVLYAKDYPYRSGITKELAVYQKQFAESVIAKLGIEQNSLAIDIGSNDGTLLTGFQSCGLKALGVEPTDIAKIARSENNIETIQSFFTETLAGDIKKDYGPAKVVTMTNVFAHMAPLGEVMRGIVALLDDDGVFITESHYLLDVVRGNQYDTVYHEHLRTYSLKSLVTLFEYYGLEVFDVQRADRYGGNIRAYVGRTGQRGVTKAVRDALNTEEEFGLGKEQTFVDFRQRVQTSKYELMEFAYKAKKEGWSFVGNSCPGRCVTLLNHCGMGKDLLPYLAEQPTSLKLGKYLPGLGQPIVENSILIDQQPDCVLLLAWHYAKPISEQLRKRGLKSKLYVPLPEFKELKA